MTAEQLKKQQWRETKFTLWVLLIMIIMIMFMSGARNGENKEVHTKIMEACIVNKEYKTELFEMVCRVDKIKGVKVNTDKVIVE